MADVARHLSALHVCLHEGQEQQARATASVAKKLDDHRADSRKRGERTQDQLADLNGRVSFTEGQLKIIGRTVGAPEPAPAGQPQPVAKRRLGNVQPWQAATAGAAALVAAQGGYKLIAAAIAAFHASMMAGG